MYTKSNKEIYRFTINLEQEIEKEVDVEKEIEVEREVEVTKTRKDDSGKTEKYKESVLKKVKEKEVVKEKRTSKEKVPHVFVIKQPNRRQMEEADMEFSIEMSRCVKQGILTKAMLLNKYTDTGGIMSESEAKELSKLYSKLSEKQTEFTAWKISDKSNFTEKQKAVIEEISSLRRVIAQTETNYSALLNHTADHKAQTRVIGWYLLSLAHIEKDGELEQFFKGTGYEEKKENLYKLEEEEDDLLAAVYDKLIAFISFWYFSVSTNFDDFVDLEKDIEAGNL